MFWVISLIILSCSGEGGKQPASHPSSTSTLPASSPFLYINTLEDINLGSVSVGEEVIIEAGSQRIIGQWDGKRRIYYDAGNKELFRVKSDEEGMKLLNNDVLIVKVKWNYPDGKLKVAFNEEMTDSYEIKTKEGNRFKVDYKEAEFKQYHLMGNQRDEVLADSLKIGGFGLSKGSGLLLLGEIGLAEKLAVIAELTLVGK